MFYLTFIYSTSKWNFLEGSDPLSLILLFLLFLIPAAPDVDLAFGVAYDVAVELDEEEAVFVGGVYFVVADWEWEFEGALEFALCDSFFDEFVALDVEIDLALHFKLLRAYKQLDLFWVYKSWQAHNT